MGIFKKIISILLIISLLSTFFSSKVFANTASEENGDMMVSSNNMEFLGTNSVGNMLAEELANVSNQQQESGNIIFSVTVDRNLAYIEYSTAVECTLFVGIYTENQAALLASGNANISPDTESIEIELSGSVPEYFYVKAFLIDPKDYAPLSTAYENPMYTQEMQEFFSKTTEDFEEDRVINIDEDKTNNFAVLADDVIVLKGDNNRITSADFNSNVYTFENIDEEILSLEQGDTVSCTHNNEPVIIKVDDVSINGNKATITAIDAEVEEVFDYVKFHTDTGITQSTVDDTASSKDIEFKGYESRNDDSFVAKFALNYELIDNDGAKCSIKGSFSFSAKFTADYYVTVNYKHIEAKFDYEIGDAEITITGEVEVKFPIAAFSFGIPAISASITPDFVIAVGGSITLEGTLLKGTVGFSWNSLAGVRNLTTSPKMEAEIKAEISISIGLSIDPTISIICGLAEIKLEANLGLEAAGTLFSANSSDVHDDSKIHDCKLCVSGDIHVKFDLKIKGILFKSDKLTIEFQLAEYKVKLTDFYICFTHANLGMTTCPYIKYKSTIFVSNEKDVLSEGLEVIVNNNTYYTDKNGEVTLYLPNGEYSVFVSDGKCIGGTGSLTVENEPATCYIKTSVYLMTKTTPHTLSLGFSHTGIVSETGELFAWGQNRWGTIGVGDQKNRLSPVKVMENVASIDMGGVYSAAITNNGDLYIWGGVNRKEDIDDGKIIYSNLPVKMLTDVIDVCVGKGHIAAIKSNGDLYMIGLNRFYQIGDGTNALAYSFKKIMSNVASVSLGMYHSAAVTKNGELYLWGYNRHGQIGDGTTNICVSPKKIMDNIAMVSLGGYHTAAVTRSGELYMWGQNTYGQIGDGTKTNCKEPKKILNGIYLADMGYTHSAAVDKDGFLYLWGDNEFGQLGNGTYTASLTPEIIMLGCEDVSLGVWFSAIVDYKGELYTWGYNNDGQLGNGTIVDKNSPIKITIPKANSTYKLLRSNNSNSIASVSAMQEAHYENLLPNTVYNFYIMKDNITVNALSNDNILYVEQGVTDSVGKIDFTYDALSEEFLTYKKFAVPIKSALPSLEEISPIVTFNNEKVYLKTQNNILGGVIYENISAEIFINNNEYQITEYTLSDGNIIFSCDITGELAEKSLITAKIYATHAGMEYTSNDILCSLIKARSDLNADGELDAYDVPILVKALLKSSSTFDVNGDKRFDVRDLVRLKKYLAG